MAVVTGIAGLYGDWSQEILEALARKREEEDAANGSSAGSADESTAVAAQAVKSLDADKSSSLSLKESGLSQAAFAAADRDADGKLSVTELAGALADERALIAAGLASGDSPDAIAAALIGRIDLLAHMTELADKFMSLLDTNGDSALSLKESGLSKEDFGRVDADNDGVLSHEELAQALADERRELEAAKAGAGSGSGQGSSSGAEESGAGDSGTDGSGEGDVSDLGRDSIFNQLLRQAGRSAAVQPRQIMKALQAYGAGILASALSEDDSGAGSWFSGADTPGSGQAGLDGLLGGTSADGSQADLSMGLAGYLDFSV